MPKQYTITALDFSIIKRLLNQYNAEIKKESDLFYNSAGLHSLQDFKDCVASCNCHFAVSDKPLIYYK